MKERLQNLEVLVNTCRSENAREFIEEAVMCYEAGAIRSAIVATWTAVFFDLLDKARELGISGDIQAQKLVDRFDRAEAGEDIAALLKLESGILETVRKDLELFSDFEFRDITRIQEDRHRCAHPTLDGRGNRFVPSPELARTHIVNAITILLQQPPVQGKAAIEGILSVVSSKLFPSDTVKATTALKQTGLSRPRSSLLRNIVLVFLKSALRPKGVERSFHFNRALKVVLAMHRKDVLVILEAEFSRVLRSVEDHDLSNVVFLLSQNSEIVQFVEEDQLERLRSFVRTLGADDMMYIDSALELQETNDAAMRRISWMSLKEIKSSFFFALPIPIGDRLIELLKKSGSFEVSNEICVEIRRHLRDLNKSQLDVILAVGDGNNQVAGAFDYENLKDQINFQLGG